MKSSKIALTALGTVCFLFACSGSSSSNGGSATGGAAGTAGSGTAGSGTAGSGTAGSGTAGSGTAGTAGVGTGTFSTGLPGNTPLGSVTAGQATQICMQEAQFFTNSGIDTFLCRMTATEGAVITAQFSDPPPSDAEFQMLCEQLQTDCTTSSMSDCMSAMNPDPSCTATIADFEACMNAIPAVAQSANAALPECSMLTVASGPDALTAAQTAFAEPAPCVALDMKCPGATANMPSGG